MHEVGRNGGPRGPEGRGVAAVEALNFLGRCHAFSGLDLNPKDDMSLAHFSSAAKQSTVLRRSAKTRNSFTIPPMAAHEPVGTYFFSFSFSEASRVSMMFLVLDIIAAAECESKETRD